MERLTQWVWLIANQSLFTLERQHIEAYIVFCQKPPTRWIGTKVVVRFIKNEQGEHIPNPGWRLFVATTSKSDVKYGIKAQKKHYQLSDKSLREIFTIISSFYTYLVNEGKVGTNPISLIRQKNKYFKRNPMRKQVMKLSDKQWSHCLSVAEKLAKNNPEKHERTLFILNVLYLLYLRVSECVAKAKWEPVMSHFFQDSQDYWWFITTGKGNK